MVALKDPKFARFSKTAYPPVSVHKSVFVAIPDNINNVKGFVDSRAKDPGKERRNDWSSGSRGSGREQREGAGMWHFAISVFLIELYGHNLLLTAMFGLVVAGSVLIFGVLIGDWIDRKPRNKAAVIPLVALANLASTSLTITIQKDWIVNLTSDNRGQLVGMNAAVQWLDQIINIFVPLSVSQVMTWASHMIGCGFILGWNLVSLLVEFLFLPRVYQLVPQLAVKPQQQRGGHFQERQHEAVNIQEGGCACAARGGRRTTGAVFLAGLGLAFLYMMALGFDCITTSYAYTQGVGGSLLSILMALSV
ncbi:hypothetical protein GH733_013345 [Mirounga leonina]|nr:hypothetical protein GH733_013345 [Mirounga leonina]